MVAEKPFNDPHLPQTVRVEQHDHRFQIMIVDHGHKLAALGRIKSADVLISACVAAHLKKEGEVRSAERTVGGSDDADLRAQGLPPTVVALRNSIKVSPSERKCCKKTWDADSDGGNFERAKRSGKIASGRYGTRNEKCW